MDLRRVRLGEWLGAASALVLLPLMWVDWYSGDAPPGPFGLTVETGSSGVNAWEAFAITDVLLALAALVALAGFVATATQRTPAVPVALSSLAVLTGTLAALAALVRLAVVPDAPGAGDAVREAGVYLGVLASLGVCLGAWFSARDEGFGLRPPSGIDSTRPELAPPVEVRPLPAPQVPSKPAEQA